MHISATAIASEKRVSNTYIELILQLLLQYYTLPFLLHTAIPA